MRIMLVDDHLLLRESLKRQIQESGHEVVADLSDGSSAVAVALKVQPDIYFDGHIDDRRRWHHGVSSDYGS